MNINQRTHIASNGNSYLHQLQKNWSKPMIISTDITSITTEIIAK